MSIYLYIFIMTISIVSVVFVATNTYLKSHDKLFVAIEELKQTKVSNANELSWKPSDAQMDALRSKLPVIMGTGNYVDSLLESLYNDLKKLM